MYIVEIEGRPIAIMNSEKDVADEFFNGEVFKDDLLVLDDADGKPLWDGSAELFIRRAFAEEIAAFERKFTDAVRDGTADRDDEDGYLVFLLPVRDPTDDDDDDDDYDD